MPLTSDEVQDRIDALLRADDFSLAQWNPAFGSAPLTMTYRFETEPAADFPWDNVSAPIPYSESDKGAVRAALDHYETLINVVFVEDTTSADANLSFYRAADLYTDSSLLGGGRGRWTFASGFEWDGHAVFRDTFDLASELNTDLVLHEIGHMLGLKHPGNYDVSAGNEPPGPFLPADEDNEKYTAMSYNPNPDASGDTYELRLYDVAALQAWWNANDTTRDGDTEYLPFEDDLLSTIWDGGGQDALRNEGRRDTVMDLREGAFSSEGGLDLSVIAFGTVIENAFGGNGIDKIIGNEADNRLSGGKGRDVIKGAAGKDVLLGGKGADRLIGGPGADKIDGGSGSDRMIGGSGADVFVYDLEDGRDRLLDFADDKDTLLLDSDLWGGGLRKAQVVNRYASVEDGDTVFDFGDGDILRLKGFTDLDALPNDMELV